MADSEADTKTPPSSSPVDLSGKWQLDRNENFDEYMKAAGFGIVKRKMVQALSPVEEIEQEEEAVTVEEATADAGSSSGRHRVTICTRAAGFKRRCAFTVGVEYGETHPMWGDKEQRVLAAWEAGGARLVQRALLPAPGGDAAAAVPEKSFEREIVDGEMMVTMRLGEVVARRYFKRI